LVQEFVNTAKLQGEGWVEYRWLNPETKRMQRQVSYVKDVPELGVVTYVTGGR
jgi:signal transduction histidine kinase